jgi:pimeloyl-ACP methyl ester carboxylesterase
MTRAPGHGVSLQLAVWEGDGEPILCVHGLTANCRSFDTIAGKLAGKNAFVAFDLRGRGLSDKPPTGYSIAHHVRDLKMLVEHLGLERVRLMGHSLGAIVVAAFAAEYPARTDSVILLDGAGKLNEEQLAGVFQAIEPAISRLGKTFESFEAYVDEMKRFPFFKSWTPEMETYFRYEMEPAEGGIRTRTKIDYIEEEIGNLASFDILSIYQQMSCPTLVLRAPVGMGSPKNVLLPKNALKAMVEHIDDLSIVNIGGTNHYSIVFGASGLRDGIISSFVASDLRGKHGY